MKIPEGWPTEEMIDAGKKVAARLGIHATVTLFKAMLEAAPTPPAQDEPVHQSSWDKVYWADISKTEFAARQGVIHTRTLYTRPDNSELRKAAWKYLKSNSYGTAEERRRDLENLRAALEGK